MIKADKYLKETIQEILESGNKDISPRPKWQDGTPAHTKFVTQKVFEYNIADGDFPITTLRNGSLKTAFQELKTLYIDQSNKQEDFIKNGVNWWGDWMNEEGNLGTAYAWNLETGIKEHEVIKPAKVDFSKIKTDIEVRDLINPIQESVDGVIYQKNINKGFIIVDKRVSKSSINGQWKYKIQFLNTGSYKIIRGNDLYKQVKLNVALTDFCERDEYGIGYTDNTDLSKNFSNEYKKWKSLIKRCYSKNGKVKNYENCLVSTEWHSFDNFVRDLPYIPNYFLAKRDNFKGWELDKDYFSDDIKVYSLDTCVFLPEKHNIIYTSRNYFKVTNSEGVVNLFIGIDRLANFINVSNGALTTYLYRNRKKNNKNIINYKNFLIERVGEPLRYVNSKNQVNELLKDLENNRFSRRHTLSFYNWKDQNKKQLVECAFQNLFSVREVNNVFYIDQTLIQRSSDFILAGMINCSQYVMLNMIICNHLKYKTKQKWAVGKFVWVVQNCHIYDRHFNGAKEILERESTGLQPKIELICEPKDFYSHTIEDFKFTNLEGIKPLSEKLEIAV